MKALRALKIVLKDEILSSQRAYLEEAIAELEELMKSKSCEGCKHFILYGTQKCCLAYEREETLCIRQHGWLDKYEPKETL